MQTAVILASGKSLEKYDVDYCQGKAKIYAVNNTYQLAPWADVLYACDKEWWDTYKPDFKGEKWTINKDACEKYGLNHIDYDSQLIFSDKDIIATGNNSGFQAMNLAYLHGYKRIILLGFDYMNSGQHFFGRHPHGLNKSPDMRRWVKHMRKAQPIMESLGIEVINCTRETAIDCFPQMPITEAL